MRNLIIIVVVLAAIVGVVGFKKGWFTLTTSHETGSRNVDVNLKVDSDKAKSDANEMTHIK
jgi:hypothetical protein